MASENKLSQRELLTLVDQIIDFLLKKDLFEDVIIYAGGKRYLSADYSSAANTESVEYITRNGRDTELYIEDAVASEYMEFANDETLSMSFEGPLYDALNYGDTKVEDALNHIFERHGLYFEYGDAWNLTCYFE